ncbi:hypothetical protein ACLKA6_016331 [Drosophila palustris]
MDAPQEGKIDVDLCLDCDCQSIPAYMNSVIRQQFLQQKIKSMPAAVQNRIVALKNLQLDQLHLEAEFLEKVYKLEKKYQVKYQEICEKRRDILDGTVDPAEQSPNYPQPKSPAIDQDVGDRKRVSFKIGHRMPEDAKGIPGFWLTVFRNTPMLSELIQKHDEPVMRKLTDIVFKYDAGHSYFLEFHFDKNEYFSNTVLTKQYFLKSSVDKNEPFAFKGFQIYKCKGCIINWEKKMNLTVAIIQKKQKHRIRGAIRTVFRQTVKTKKRKMKVKLMSPKTMKMVLEATKSRQMIAPLNRDILMFPIHIFQIYFDIPLVETRKTKCRKTK